MRALLHTAGERVELRCAVPWLAAVLAEGAGGQLTAADPRPPDVRVTVEPVTAAFDVRGWEVLTRGAWRRQGQVIMQNACSSGLDLLVTAATPTLEITARWRPAATVRAASAVLRARSRLLLRAVLLQYPALWRSQQRGRVPLHASVCGTGGSAGSAAAQESCGKGGRVVLLAGPGGTGKSTLVTGELARGAVATCDNLCVTDGHTVWGLAEPLRVAAGTLGGPFGPSGVSGAAAGPPAPGRPRGRRMPHGRREMPWPGRAECLVPDCLAVLARGNGDAPEVTACDPAEAAGALAAGTYMAGELRRYWAFAATLAFGTGTGDPHPAVREGAAVLSTGLPCLKIILGRHPGPALREVLPAGLPGARPAGSGRGTESSLLGTAADTGVSA
jgi:hypothetical protein